MQSLLAPSSTKAFDFDQVESGAVFVCFQQHLQETGWGFDLDIQEAFAEWDAALP
jgi:hypothetical protein